MRRLRMNSSSSSNSKKDWLSDHLQKSSNRHGRDIQSVCRLIGIEPGQVRFLETEFGLYLNKTEGNPGLSSFSAEQIKLLQHAHQRLFVDGKSVSDVHRELRKSREKATSSVHIITVTSGKGGVGKTTLSINLAIAMTRRGSRALVVDADLGMGNVHVLTGLAANGSIADVLHGGVDIHDVLIDGPGGIKVLCGGSGVAGLANLDPTLISRLGYQLRSIGDLCDVVLVDTGAGISSQVLKFLQLADDIVLVTTPDLSAMLDGYGVMKVARGSGVKAPVHVLVNHVENEREPETVFHRIHACAERYLNEQPEYLGSMKRDPYVHQGNRDRNPVALMNPRTESVSTLDQLAATLHPKKPIFAKRNKNDMSTIHID